MPSIKLQGGEIRILIKSFIFSTPTGAIIILIPVAGAIVPRVLLEQMIISCVEPGKSYLCKYQLIRYSKTMGGRQKGCKAIYFIPDLCPFFLSNPY